MSDKQITVLLVEDNPGDIKFTSILLEKSKAINFRFETRQRLSGGMERLAQGGVDILLLDLGLPDGTGLNTFERVHAAFPHLPVVILSNLDDEGTAIRAVEAGAQDYLIKGQVESVSLVRALLFAIERQKKQAAADASPKGRILVLVGAKGGEGTTTVALNLAAGIAQQGRSVIAVELRSNFGTFSPYLGYRPTGNLSRLLDMPAEPIDPKRVAAQLTEFSWGLRALFGPQSSKEYRQIEAEQAEAVLDALVHMADYLIIDLPDAYSPPSQVAARRCKFGGVVLNNDPVSITCAARMLDELEEAGASRPLLQAIVVNRSDRAMGVKVTDIADQLACPVLGVVTPAAELCLRSQTRAMPLVLVDPDSIASGRIQDMVEKLLSSKRSIAAIA